MNIVKGKIALITGASSGIGLACAHVFAKHGANLILVARREDRLKELARELSEKYNIHVDIFPLDVRNNSDIENMAKTLENKGQTPYFLINSAGLSRGKDDIHRGNLQDWNEMIDTNIKGVLYVIRAILPSMVKNNAGHVINLGSISGEEVYRGGNVYHMTKFAINGLSRAMALDLQDTNIKVTNIEPGAVETEFSIVRFKGDTQKADDTYTGFKPLLADDIADIIFFAANSPEHVNVQKMIVMPTAQRSISVFRREND